MSNPVAIEAARNGKRRAIEKVYDYLTLHEAKATTDGDLADRLRIPKQDVRNLRYDLVEIGSLRVERQPQHGHGRVGALMAWTLVEPLQVSKARLDAKWRKDDARTAELMRKPNPAKARKATSDAPSIGAATPEHPVAPDVLVASAGPQPTPALQPSLSSARFDEPRALIEAARQYANVNGELDKKIKELEGLGMVVDRGALAKAIKAPHDHQLLIVSKVLPYVTGLERQVERLSQQNVDLREKASTLQDVQRTNERLSEQNKRLVSELTQERTRNSNRTNGAEPAAARPAPADPGKAVAPTPAG